MKGNITIEAAYLFPFCFIVIGIVCVLGMYQYNRAVLQITGYECILQTMEMRNLEEEVIEETICQNANEKGKARTFGIVDLTVHLKITDLQVSLTYSGTQKMLRIPLQVRAVYQRTHPERTLRLMERFSGE